MKATLKFLGHGGAFAKLANGNSNAVLTINGKNLMIDFGIASNFIWADEWGRSYNEIDAFYITHLHLDHCCLESAFFSRYFIPKLDKHNNVIKPRLYCHPMVLAEIWEHLKPSMGLYQNQVLHITNFAECVACDKFEFEGVEFQLIRNQHIESSFGKKDAYGLLFELNGKTIYWSSDSANINTEMIEKADIVFHDCETLEGFKSNVHAHWDDLRKLPENQKKKMWLMHYSHKPKNWEMEGFAGFVQKNDEFSFNL